MPYPRPLVDQIDSIAIRTQQPERLFAFFSETLGLPVASPLTAYPALTSGSILLGNTRLEIVRYGPPGSVRAPAAGRPNPSRGFVLTFEPKERPLDEVAWDLRRREVPHSDILPFYGRTSPACRPVKMWANLVLGGLFGDNVLAQPFFSLSRISRRVPTAQEVAAQAPTVMKRLIDSCFPNGAVFFTEYYQRMVGRRRDGEWITLRDGEGGPLGIRRMQEVRVGARYLAAARERWGRVLNPLQPEAPGYWRLGDGPTLRLILNGTDGIQTLALRVRSLRQAQRFLRERNLVRGEFDDELLVRVPDDRDLDIRLVA